jgi:Tfp pilus assembly protein PilX
MNERGRRSSVFGAQRGIALLTAVLVMLLMSSLMVGFTTVVMSDQRERRIDRDRNRAFYAAQSGLEKLTADLANLFFTNVAPTNAQIAALSNSKPAIPDVTFTTSGPGAYAATFKSTTVGQVTTGPYAGLTATKKTYELNATARTTNGSEVHLRRGMETVAIPVFQFGMFSDVDLSFHAGPNFNFGGRVHTNGNLFLAEGNGATLTLPDKVTAVGEVVRKRLSNGTTIIDSSHQGTVSIATAPGSYRSLAVTEGSVTDSLGSSLNEPTWTSVSLSAYNGYIRNGRTGARPLNLGLVAAGGVNVDLIRRPVLNEEVTDPALLAERYFSQVGLRILLSDTAANITTLPTITNTPPVRLDGDWKVAPPNNGTAYGPVNATHPPVALSPGPVVTTTTANTAAGDATINAIVPLYFQPANVPMTLGVNNNVRCTGRTLATRFTGCTNIGAAAAIGSVISATVDSVVVSTTTTAATNAGAATIDVVNTNGFAPNTFWLNNTLVTCTGNTPTTFTGCTGTPASVLPATIGTAALSAAGTGLVGGFIKIEMQDTTKAWRDVTMEILNWGFAGPNLAGALCADPNPNAIIRVQRLRDNGNAAACTYAASQKSSDYWPNVLFDPREGLYRDVSPGANLMLGGVMHYVALDVANLSEWFTGTGVYAGGSGINAFHDNNGYAVYFSDRRNNRDAAGNETAEYGFEDIVNPAVADGTPNGVRDQGEDVNVNDTLETYGQFPAYDGTANTVPPGAGTPLNLAARPTTALTAPQAKVNRAILFRRALKLVNGGLGNIVAPGLTVASENPVYVQGDWNANAAGFGNPHVATSIAADSVTLLSNNWNDNVSMNFPYTPASRPRSAQSYYRFAVLAGKNAAFPRPTGWPNDPDFGTDGGAHNFLRMLESGGTVNYRGAVATFFFSRQAVGVYKCCDTVYSAPTRNFNFDSDFFDLAKLPPLTPVFRDLNALGFSQEMRPGQ